MKLTGKNPYNSEDGQSKNTYRTVTAWVDAEAKERLRQIAFDLRSSTSAIVAELIHRHLSPPAAQQAEEEE